MKDAIKGFCVLIFAIIFIFGLVFVDLSCKKASLERVAGKEVSWWDVFVLTKK